MKETIKELINIQINSLNEQNAVIEINSVRFKNAEELKFYHNQKLQIITAKDEAEKQLQILLEKEKENEEKKS